MSLDTLLLLKAILDMQQLNVGAPDFPDVAAKVLRARQELDAAIKEAHGNDS